MTQRVRPRTSTRPPRRCPDCGADITETHPNTRRCSPCAAAARAASKRRYQKRCWADPEWRAREGERARGRYQADPEWRGKRQRRARTAMQELRERPGHREERNARARRRYREDPEYRERKLASSRESYHRKRGTGGTASPREFHTPAPSSSPANGSTRSRALKGLRPRFRVRS